MKDELVTSLDYSKSELKTRAYEKADEASQEGMADLLKGHTKRWADIWSRSDIVIRGDVEAQQGIRFNIFQNTEGGMLKRPDSGIGG